MVLGLLLIASAYLIGSVASAIVVCRVMNLPDPRSGGSRNPGATNVLRVGGKTAAALTLTGDVLKGLLPVLLARALSNELVGAASATYKRLTRAARRSRRTRPTATLSLTGPSCFRSSRQTLTPMRSN